MAKLKRIAYCGMIPVLLVLMALTGPPWLRIFDTILLGAGMWHWHYAAETALHEYGEFLDKVSDSLQ